MAVMLGHRSSRQSSVTLYMRRDCSESALLAPTKNDVQRIVRSRLQKSRLDSVICLIMKLCALVHRFPSYSPVRVQQ